MSYPSSCRLLLLLMVLSQGCATPYQRVGFAGGYKDSALGDNEHLITVEVNGFTTESTAYSYFHQRAKELCAAYDVLELRSTARMGVVYFGNLPSIVQKPEVYGRIKCRHAGAVQTAPHGQRPLTLADLCQQVGTSMVCQWETQSVVVTFLDAERALMTSSTGARLACRAAYAGQPPLEWPCAPF